MHSDISRLEYLRINKESFFQFPRTLGFFLLLLSFTRICIRCIHQFVAVVSFLLLLAVVEVVVAAQRYCLALGQL